MRSPRRPRRTALAALTAGVLLVAGCAGGPGSGGNGTPGTAGAKELVLQPAGAPGPDPFTGSTAASPPPAATASPAALTGVTARTVPGSTPGLYGGTRSVASCDIGEQARLLADDRAKARAFARGAGIREKEIPAFLRGLTPVLLRADIRVTGHGYADGAPTAFQSVLQAGTAVLADTHGTPRVRCACGNPLGVPVVMKGSLTYRGEEWAGYDPNRVLVIEPSTRAITHFVLVDVADNTWIERPAGDDGGRDRSPDDPPPFDPGEGIVPSPTASAAEPSVPPAPETGAPRPPAPPAEPVDEVADPPADLPREEAVDAPAAEPQETPSGPSDLFGDAGGEFSADEQYPREAEPPVSGPSDAAEPFGG
ncbi:DUF6777 domain-containing protein [Streptomyces fulvorobeus]|uniref:DUF6777 domain-containing protein n=1 Tax=Streptomyces fulvorobeus TaxID=284028 RepID=A0A7Y9HHG6_9ACTN|nr:DUF6777 domain-containing protein [Streptomyces fulvorobeus]NYE44154.1 hypothetical protein [Streptomyces fulvorobeus]